MDKDKSGLINIVELTQALKEAGLPEQNVQEIFEQADIKGHAKKFIDYSEFLQATVKMKDLISDEKLWYLFHQFDVDNTG